MLLPRPTTLSIGEGEFELTRIARITAPAELAGAASWLQGALRPATGFPLEMGQDGGIELEQFENARPAAVPGAIAGGAARRRRARIRQSGQEQLFLGGGRGHGEALGA